MAHSLKNYIINKLINWLNTPIMPHRGERLSDFEKIQQELQLADVILIDGRMRVSQVIKIVTQSAWSHAALYIGRPNDITNPILRERVNQFYHGDPNEQLVVESLLGPGTIINPLTKYHYEHIRICRPYGLSFQDAQKVVAYTIGRLGYAYDVRQIFDLFRFLLPWHVLPRRWHSTLFTYNPGTSTKQSCSALLVEAFDSVHFPILPVVKHTKNNNLELYQRNPRLYTPSDFDFSPFFNIIKYPIFELSELGIYRDLPWAKTPAPEIFPEPEPVSKPPSSEAPDFLD